MTDAVFLRQRWPCVQCLIHPAPTNLIGCVCVCFFFVIIRFPPSLVSAELCCVGWGERWRAREWAKEEWRQSEAKARWGRGEREKNTKKKSSWVTRMRLQPGQRFLWLQDLVCVCLCVCVCVHKRQSYKGFGLLQRSLGVNLWALTLFPFSAIALSTYSKSLAFCSLSSELSLLAAAAAVAVAAAA